MAAERTVAVLLFDEVEVLDFAAPFEVFSVAGRRHARDLFDVSLVGVHPGAIQARNGFRVLPKYSIDDSPAADVVIIPGGYGSREQLRNPATLSWIARMAETSDVVLSVCTGSLLLAAAGLLRGLRATTHHGAFELLAQLEPECTVVTQRVVDTGRIVSTAGVSAGLDGSLHVVRRLTSPDVATECAHYIEYEWRS